MADYKNVLIVGASSTIAQAFVERLNQEGKCEITQVSASELEGAHHVPHDEQAIAEFCQQQQSENVRFDAIYMFNGVLHAKEFGPEKSLSQLNDEQLHAVFHANAVIPLIWIKHLAPLLVKQEPSLICALSARVGSISDNQLGGWYSYRASKAALNMLLNTAIIELKRTHKQLKGVLFHPGTTDTPLSKPFQKNVPEGKLFTPEYVAQCLYQQTCDHPRLKQIQYIDYSGKDISY